ALILPGVGHFDYCINAFNNSGLRDSCEKMIIELKVPILGICAGAQIMTERSEEGDSVGLGWVNGRTVKFKDSDQYRIPNIGWRDIVLKSNNPLFEDVDNENRFYFTHSYHFSDFEEENILCHCEFPYEFVAAFQDENILGVQFHPEKSHKFGMQLFKNFAHHFSL
ncbi:imidazole glycerol phosphate synthase subunit HisH, partial [Winogradskyella sp.]|nr:imidazole glycerol phosphate synthase subunit HisH [Winogradskyella sp.]